IIEHFRARQSSHPRRPEFTAPLHLKALFHSLLIPRQPIKKPVMDPDTLFTKLAHILDEDQIGPDYVLRSSLVWDSLSVLAIVSFIDECALDPLHVSDLQNLHTAGDLLLFLNSRIPVHHAPPAA
ncbi:MAG: hypothetical protein ACKO2P_05370, partial [Planctomycetota bacterium]